MNCKSIEELIFLYKELNSTERALVDKHIIGCASCKELLLQINHQHQLVSKVAEIPVLSANYTLMKSRILKGIEPDPRINLLDKILLRFEHRWLQSTMAIVSIILIGFFASEVFSVEDLRYSNKHQANAPTLNTQHFFQTYKKRRESPKTISLYDQTKTGDFKISKN